MTTSREPRWLEAEARVTVCTYQFARLNTLTLGVAAQRHSFVITFTYYAHSINWTDQFTSPTYVEQGTRLPLLYNPLAPQQNSLSAANPSSRSPLFAIGVAGSIILSLLWLMLLRSCS